MTKKEMEWIHVDPDHPLEVVVERSTWLRGEGPVPSVLYRSDGKMCCLGSVGIACGIRKSVMAGVKGPSHFNSIFGPLWPVKGMANFRVSTIAATKIMGINDNPRLLDADREGQLIVEGAKLGILFKFVD